jgi:hypothetical protein
LAHQPWHQDEEAIIGKMEDGRDLPPYVLNVFVPLDQVTKELGPTKFWLKSHKERTAKEIMKVLATSTNNDDHTNNNPIIGPTLSCGSVFMYNYCICYRGTHSLSDTSVCPMLYDLMYAQPWFQEHLNFGLVGLQRLFPTTTATQE